MLKMVIEQSDTDILTAHSGLAPSRRLHQSIYQPRRDLGENRRTQGQDI